MLASLLAFLFTLSSPLAATATPPAVQSAERAQGARPAAARPLDRAVVLGASLSDGYGLKGLLGFRATLASYLDASLTGERAVHACHSDSRFFIDPERNGARLAAAALKERPSLVIALDFLFWYLHGDRFPSERHRLESLEIGLALLDSFDCPLVVADIPDVRVALRGKGPLGVPMIYPSMLPKPETLRRANARIREWVRERNGAFVQLNRFLRHVVEDQAFALRGNSWPPNSLPRVLQKDFLHPSPSGYLGVLVIAQDAMARQLPGIGNDDFRWKVEELETLFIEHTRDARRAAAAKNQAREERVRNRRRDR